MGDGSSAAVRAGASTIFSHDCGESAAACSRQASLPGSGGNSTGGESERGAEEWSAGLQRDFQSTCATGEGRAVGSRSTSEGAAGSSHLLVHALVSLNGGSSTSDESTGARPA